MGTLEPDDHDVLLDGQTRELADKLRLLASFDPELARVLVTELVVALDRATAGAFGARLSPASRSALGLSPPAGPTATAASGSGTTTIRS